MKIGEIHSSYTTSKHKNTTARRLNKLNTFNNSSVSKTELSFKGGWYPSGYYEDDEIEAAKKYIRQFGDEWKKAFKKEKGKKFGELYWDESYGLNHITAILTRPACSDWEEAKLVSRGGFGFGTAGLWELASAPFTAAEAGIRKIADSQKLNKKAERVARLIMDMKAAEEEEAKQRAAKLAAENLKKMEDDKRLTRLKNEINNGFIKLIDDEKMGKTVEIPNVIMIEDRARDFGDDLMRHTRQKSNILYKIVIEQSNTEMQKDLYESLKNAKTLFDKTGIRSLIEVQNMEKMITPETADFSLSEWMKGVMTACASKYKSTILFKTFDSSKIVSEALEPHRIGLKIINSIKR